ncbi:MAG: YtxH domain-containing protein [Helicobacteraceae bacterium]|jgi:hypothetical protein|nr:YtxH domain-containing protein [Helicobacteraceae bacterium]
MENESEKIAENAASSFVSDIANAIFGGSSKEQFIKGALIGGAAAYLLTNEAAQKALFKAAVRFGAAGARAFGEMKDRFEDAKAELGKEDKEGE